MRKIPLALSIWGNPNETRNLARERSAEKFFSIFIIMNATRAWRHRAKRFWVSQFNFSSSSHARWQVDAEEMKFSSLDALTPGLLVYFHSGLLHVAFRWWGDVDEGGVRAEPGDNFSLPKLSIESCFVCNRGIGAANVRRVISTEKL